LLQGKALQDALGWAADKSLSPQDYQFFNASQEAEKRALTEANRILAEAQAKANQKLRWGMGILVFALTALVGTGIFSGWLVQRARESQVEFEELQGEIAYAKFEQDTVKVKTAALQAQFLQQQRPTSLDGLLKALETSSQLQPLTQSAQAFPDRLSPQYKESLQQTKLALLASWYSLQEKNA
jgi:hypothetical protein